MDEFHRVRVRDEEPTLHKRREHMLDLLILDL